jgi:hypothetical protein
MLMEPNTGKAAKKPVNASAKIFVGIFMAAGMLKKYQVGACLIAGQRRHPEPYQCEYG